MEKHQCRTEALKYKNRTDFSKYSIYAYNIFFNSYVFVLLLANQL